MFKYQAQYLNYMKMESPSNDWISNQEGKVGTVVRKMRMEKSFERWIKILKSFLLSNFFDWNDFFEDYNFAGSGMEKNIPDINVLSSIPKCIPSETFSKTSLSLSLFD